MRFLTHAILLPQILLTTAFAAPIVFPQSVTLIGPESSQQLLVYKRQGDVRMDVTRQVNYRSVDTTIAHVSTNGIVEPKGEGSTQIEIEFNNSKQRIQIRVENFDHPTPVSFQTEIVPILTKATCNSGGCHGKAEGQNGFQLSIFGFDPLSDHDAITKQARGRRINQAAAAESLLLRKATATVPHGGGQKIKPDSLWYRRVERWITEGAKFDAQKQAGTFRLVVTPSAAVLQKQRGQQLQVFAIDQDNNRSCVTREAEFFTNDAAVAKVDHTGWVQVQNVPGEAAILVRHRGQVAVSRVTLPQNDRFQRPAENNPIDRHIGNQLVRLGIQPSPISGDSEFIRRVFLDVIGTLPTVAECETFLTDSNPQKRDRLIDHLLQRKEYSDFWAMKWADILRVDQEIVKPQGTLAMTRWLKRQLQGNRPYDQMAREIISVQGNTHAETPAAFYSVHKDAEMLGRSISQIFLGVRIECAQCHQHPFEKWGQHDYYAFSSFFTGIGRKGVSGGGTKIFDQPGKDLQHPRTKQPIAAAGLGAPPSDLTTGVSRRMALADWISDPKNEFLAPMLVNRMWAHYFGRGLVEPIDDMRATNPASNPQLMEFLVTKFVASQFDVKQLTKLMLTSRTYQQTSQANRSNQRDSQNYSHAAWKAIPAEVLLDAICQVTGVPEVFNGWPRGYRAIEVWDNRMPSYFFRIFGKPQRVTVCECERGNEPSIPQALYLMNAPESIDKIRHRHGNAAKLAKSKLTDGQVIRHLYLATLSRIPTQAELKVMRQAFSEADNRRVAIEDIMWALLNTREFVFNH